MGRGENKRVSECENRYTILALIYKKTGESIVFLDEGFPSRVRHILNYQIKKVTLYILFCTCTCKGKREKFCFICYQNHHSAVNTCNETQAKGLVRTDSWKNKGNLYANTSLLL